MNSNSNKFAGEPIAIIGSGCRFPGDSSSPSKLWDLLLDPRDVSRPIDRYQGPSFYHKDGHHHGASNVSDAYLLSEDPCTFDNQFFNIQPAEAEAIDPQQRLVLESVYESLESAGLAIENLRGSSTAVFVGVMCDDYGGIAYYDSEAIPTYAATGIARSILSNRVSFVFDWRGPSMTIDTACSSSLVALHQAVQVLRDGTSQIAVAAGANLIFSPNGFIAESNLNMLSPTGKSRMWDAEADGYARGEGIAAVVMKRLSAALADGDHIECVIRETGVNQDGHTPGITMPSPNAQTRLIQETYAKAGLDLNDPLDRCQYFEAHGTGTQAGDGVESRAIYDAFFDKDNDPTRFPPLFCGSIKTVIGHTEGTAGLAGVLKVALAIQNKTIPPNMHFNELNPKIAPYYGSLQVPTKPLQWPKPSHGQDGRVAVRRASVNSFGFGGTNAHAIVEGYEPDYHGSSVANKPSSKVPRTLDTTANALPFVFSASSERSLVKMLTDYVEYLDMNPKVDVSRLAWTLYRHRSTFPFRISFSAQTANELVEQLRKSLEDKASGARNPFVRGKSEQPRVLGVFTGQGAQWATMGRNLIQSSVFARETVQRLEASLDSLEPEDRPSWSLMKEMLTEPALSRISEGELSQPLCTALQVLVVNMLRRAGVSFDSVVGHSSGEIGAAYAAGFISESDSIRIAYFRGRYAHLAKGPHGQKGGMMAAGTDMEDAQELCALEAFEGRLRVAASNSSSSVTLSGDEDAVDWALEVFADEAKFNRKLRLDTAYHSHHMDPCSIPYRLSLAKYQIQVLRPADGSCRWFSSVHAGKEIRYPCDELQHDYWVANMANPVLFSHALEAALKTCEQPPTTAIEVGPHPALKGPATSVIQEVLGLDIVYSGTICRKQNDVDALAACLGSLWMAFGKSGGSEICTEYRRLFEPGPTIQQPESPLRNLPQYPWNHERTFWLESRLSRSHRLREEATHSLLGVRTSTTVPHELRWRNFLQPGEIPWASGHKIQGQMLFPAAGFLVMAIEAARRVAVERIGAVCTMELLDSRIHRALAFLDDRGIETLLTLNIDSKELDESTESVDGHWTIDACTQKNSGAFTTFASGRLRMVLAEEASTSSLISRDYATGDNDGRMIDVDVDMFYANLEQLGYNYAGLFRSITSLKRATDCASGDMVVSTSADDDVDLGENYILHPAALDVAFQAIFAALSYPGDGALWTLHIPTHIRRVIINPAACPVGGGADTTLEFQAHSRTPGGGKVFGDVDLFLVGGSHALAQVEGLEVTPVSQPTEKDDREMFAETLQFIAEPDADVVLAQHMATAVTTPDQYDNGAVEWKNRLAFYYLRQLLASSDTGSRVRDWAQQIVDRTAAGLDRNCKIEWMTDSEADADAAIEALSGNAPYQSDIQLLKDIGEALCGEAEILKDALLPAFYQRAKGVSASRSHLRGLVNQIGRRFPQMHVLEVGSGNASESKKLIQQLKGFFSSYTYSFTEHDVKFEVEHEETAPRLATKKLDLNCDIEEQGFTPGTFHLVIAASGLPCGEEDGGRTNALRNARLLLKPGGYLVLLESANPGSLVAGLCTGIASQHLKAPHGIDTSESSEPRRLLLNLEEWDSLLRSTGFSGIETATPDSDAHVSVFVSQANDSQISAIRQPLAAADRIGGSIPKIPHLLIIGGRTFPVARMVHGIQLLLSPFCEEIRVLKTIEKLQSSDLDSKPHVLSLVELDAPFFSPLTQPAFKALQLLLERSKLVLWAVEGANGTNPYGNMMKGLIRCLLVELEKLFCQIFNFEEPEYYKDHARLLSEGILRLHIADAWKKGYDPVWTTERELTVKNGKLFVTRYLPAAKLNPGYNTMRRPVTVQTAAVTVDQCVAIIQEPGSNTNRLQLQHRHSPILTAEGYGSTASLVTVTIHQSVLNMVKIDSIPRRMYLSLGSTEGSSSKVLVVSEQQQSTITVPSSCILYLSEQNISGAAGRVLLAWVAGYLAADSIVENRGNSGLTSSIILHEPSSLLAHLVDIKAKQRGIHAVFTTKVSAHGNKGAGGKEAWHYIHPHAPGRIIQKAVCDQQHAVSSFISCVDDEISCQIQKYLPTDVRQSSINDFVGHQSAVSATSLHNFDIRQILVEAVEAVLPLLESDEGLAMYQDSVHEVDIQDVPEYRAKESGYHLDIVNWVLNHNDESAMVTASVLPATDQVVFQSDKTYFLIGMTGSLGLTTVTYMLSRGARYFAIASRNPKVDETWLLRMRATYGAIIEVVAMDITSRSSVESVYKSLVDTMPPIAGVANAALVMRDGLLMDLEATAFSESLGPKVNGSKYLDEIFSRPGCPPLDFFILYSSLVFVTGNTGQCAYAAGNAFMVSLIHGRRARGLVGSVMGLAGISGIGFITRTDHTILNRLDILGYGVMSEKDYVYFFAESVLAGRPESGRNPEVSAGVRYVDSTQDVGVPKWIHDPKFSTFRIENTSGGNKAVESADSVASVRMQLLEASTEEQAAEIVLDAVLAMLHKKLGLPPDESVPADVAIVELGVDSLVAVEMRGWLTTELEVSVPIVKMLGGATCTDLADDASQRLPRHLVPKLLVESGEAAAVTTAPAVPLSRAPTMEAVPKSRTSVLPLAPVAEDLGKYSPSQMANSLSSVSSATGYEVLTSAIESSDLDARGDTTASSISESISEEDFEIIRKKKTHETNNTQAPAISQASSPSLIRTEKMPIGSSRFWFLRQYLQDDTCFNVVFRARITGHVNVAKVEQAVRSIGKRHHAFRSCFFEDSESNDGPTVGLLADSQLRLEVRCNAKDVDVVSATDELLQHRFDIERGETIRMVWISLSPKDHVLIFGAHHIAVDGFSWNVVFTELDLLYRDQPLPTIQRQFIDFGVRQRRDIENGRFAKDLAFWRAMYPRIPDPLPLFPLAGAGISGGRQALTKYEHEQASLVLDKATCDKIRRGCRALRATPFHFFLAVMHVFLFRFLDVDELCIGIADANRKDVNVLGMVGFLVNLLPLRFGAPEEGATFKAVLAEVKKMAHSALEHSSLPFDILLEELGVSRSPTSSPMFQAFVDYHQMAFKMPPLLNGQADGERFIGRTAYDLTLDVEDISGSTMTVTMYTQSPLYSVAHTETLLKSCMMLVRYFADNLEAEIRGAPLFAEAEIARAVRLGRGPIMTTTWPETVSRRIDNVCAQYHNDFALQDGLGNSLTYRSMMQMVDGISQELIETHSIEPGMKVAVFQEASTLWICSILAIWRVGGTYLPLNPGQSLAHLARIVKSCSPRVIICSDATERDITSLEFDASNVVNVTKTSLGPIDSTPHYSNRSKGSSPAVILFSSGSTGEPKGIEICHTSLVNEAEGYKTSWGIGRPRVLQQSAYSFDVSLDQILTGLVNGGSLYIASASQRQDPREVAAVIAEQNITITIATPSEYTNWITHGSAILSKARSWRLACVGGEHWNDNLRASLNGLGIDGLQLQNTYGPAEASLWATKALVPLDVPCPILSAGRPLPNYSIYILGSDRNVLPTGVVGEIAIGGAGITLGYYKNPRLTAAKFVHDSQAATEHVTAGWTRMYRTGDTGYLNEDGMLVFQGRLEGDSLVKLRGMLMDMEGIENSIVKASEGALARAIATVRGEGESKFIVGFVEFSPAAVGLQDPSAYLKALLDRLAIPQAMRPAILVPLAGAIPLNAHNKVDRRTIKDLPIPSSPRSQQDVGGLTPTEQALRNIWFDVLPKAMVESVFIDKNSDFFHIGGNSLLAVRLQNRIRQTLGVFVPLVAMMETSTLVGLAALVDSRIIGKSDIDWQVETALDDDISAIRISKEVVQNTLKDKGKTVLLTGGSGFTGGHILQVLAAEPTVSHVHVVAVIPRPDDDPRRHKLLSVAAKMPQKITLHTGDLSMPRLGLSESTFAALSRQLDVVIHSGADRSFWAPYDALRGVNLQSTKELVRLSAQALRKHGKLVPIHFVSSGGQERFEKDQHQPPVDGSLGYLATKWASERYLEKAAAQLGVPVVIHRLKPTDLAGASNTSVEQRQRLFDDLEEIALRVGKLPREDMWAGEWDLMPVQQLARDIVREALSGTEEREEAVTPLLNSQRPRSRVFEHPGTIRIAWGEDVMPRLRAAPEYEDGAFERVPAHLWVGAAKAAGMKWQVTTMDMLLVDEKGQAAAVTR